jgi:hypothetical protein
MSYGAEPIYDWVVLDASAPTLTLNKTPNVSVDTVYAFTTRSSWTEGSTDRVFHITVTACSVEN